MIENSDLQIQSLNSQNTNIDYQTPSIQLFWPSSWDFFPAQKPSKSSIGNTTALRATSFRELLHSFDVS